MRTFKKLLLPLVLVSPLAMADAPKLKLELRTDFQAGLSNAGHVFKVPYARINLKGKMNDDLSYRVRFRLNKAHSSHTESVGDKVDYAYLDYKFSDTLRLRFGKHRAYYGGFEGLKSSMDIYSAGGSAIYDQSKYYRSGIGLFWKHDLMNVNLQVMNNTKQSLNSVSVASNQEKFFYGGNVTFKLLEGLLMPHIGYHADGFTEQKNDSGATVVAKSDTAQYLDAGLKLDMGAFVAVAEWSSHKMGLTSTTATDVEEELTGMKFEVGYTHGMYRPFVVYTASEAEQGTGSADVTTLEAGLEYSLQKDSDRRLHLAYGLDQTEAKSGGTDSYGSSSSDAKLILGFAGSF